MRGQSMQPRYKPHVERWVKKNPKLALEFFSVHLPIILANPYNAGPKLSGRGNYYSYHFHRKPEYRAVYSIEGTTVIFEIIGPREGVYKSFKNLNLNK